MHRGVVYTYLGFLREMAPFMTADDLKEFREIVDSITGSAQGHVLSDRDESRLMALVGKFDEGGKK